MAFRIVIIFVFFEFVSFGFVFSPQPEVFGVGQTKPKTKTKQMLDSVLETLSPTAVLRQIRKKVSADRNRFQDFQFDLDLSYITPEIIGIKYTL